MDSQKQELSAKKSDVIFLEDIIVTLKDNNNFLPIEIQKNLSSPLQKITQYVATQIQKHLLREIGQKNMSGHTLLDQVSSSLQTIRNNIQQTEQTKLDSKILIPVLVEMQSFINELKKKQQEPLSPGNIEQEINLLQMLTQKNIRSFQTTKMQCHLPELPVEYPKELQQIDLTIKELNLEKARLLQEKQILFSNKASASPFPIITPTKQFPGNGKIVGDNLTNNSKLIKGNIPQKTLQTQNLIEKVSILIYDPYTQIQEQNEFKTKVADQKCSIFSFLNEKKQDQVEFLSPGFCSKPKKLKIVDVLMKTYITLKNFFQSCKTPFQIIVLSSQIEEQPQEIVQQDVFKFTTNIKKLKAQVNIHIVQNNQQIFVQNIIKDINDMNQSDIKAKYTFSKGQIFNLIDNQQQNVQQSSNQQNEILAQQIQAHKQRALQSVESIQQQNKQEFQQSKADLKNFISQQEAEKTRQIKIMNNNKEIEQIDNKLEMEQQKRTTLLCEIELQNKKIQREQNDQETANQEVQRRLSIISQTVKSINLNEEFIVLDQCKQMANDLQILLDYLLNVQASLFLKESDILFIKYAFISNITPLNLNKGNIFDLVCEYIFKQSEPLEFRQQLSQIPLAFYLSRNTREQTLKMFQDNLNLINFLNKIVEAFDSCNLLAICSNMIMNSQKEHSNLLSMVHEAQELQFSFSKKWLFNRSTFF